MPVLNNINTQLLCVESRNLLTEKELIDEDGQLVNFDTLSLQEQNEVVQLIVENETSNTTFTKENYKKEKDRAKYIILLLGAAISLLGAGFALAPLFIVSTIVLPVLPVLLLGFAIIGITKLFLNLKINHLKASVSQATNTLDQLKEVDVNTEREIINHTLQKIEKEIIAVHSRVNILDEKGLETVQNTSQILAKIGTFSAAPISVQHIEQPANEFHNRERVPSPSHP
ncbi:MAG: hypothetical protein WAL30_00375 [Candidatus Aquirickettsiella sp.]